MDLSKLDVQPRTRKPLAQAELHPYQRAVIESALAYYYKGKSMQYDSTELTQQDRWQGGIIRETNYCPPEDPSEDRIMFSVCSAFCFEVYYYTFSGWQLLGSQLNCWTVPMQEVPESDEMVVFRRSYDHKIERTESVEERREDLEELERTIEPGDLLVGSNLKGGHVMIYVGDAFGDGGDWLIHCGGGKYSMETGTDLWEHNRRWNWEGGAILRNSLHDFLFNGDARSDIGRRRKITVLRPLAQVHKDQPPLNPAAAYRLRFPRLTVNRRANYDRLRDVEPGAEITVRLTVTNNCYSGYTEPITVTEKIPALCAYKRGTLTHGGKQLDENTLVWELAPLHVGEEVTLSYTLRVDDDPANVGKTIHLTGGSVGELPSNDIPVRIGGKHLRQGDVVKLAETEAGVKLADGKLHGAAFAEAFYEKLLGLRVTLPTIGELEKTLFTVQSYPGSTIPLLTPVEDFYAKAPMLVPTFFGGHDVWTKSSDDRTLTTLTRQMYPGDVFLAQEGLHVLGTPDCFIYLGNDRFAACGEDGTVGIKTHAETAEKLLAMRLFFGLRPTLAFKDIYSRYEV